MSLTGTSVRSQLLAFRKRRLILFVGPCAPRSSSLASRSYFRCEDMPRVIADFS